MAFRPLEPLERDYELVREIAQTETSQVVHAKRKSDGNDVVVKTLKGSRLRPEELLRFRHEYGILMELNIPGVIHIYDLRDYQGFPALVLEYFAGMTLKQYLEKGKLSLKNFFPIAIHVVSTLVEVHKKGILHLDLKPSNILLSKNRVCLTDFGISRQIGGITGTVLEGTLPYMSPEQTGRTSLGIDQRSDLYSLGVLFYEALSGQKPFQAQDMAGWVHAHLAEKPRPFPEECECPEALSSIIMKLLEKDPSQRYQSASGLLFDLHQLYSALKTNRPLENFPIATRDFRSELKPLSGLFGRTQEKEMLQEIIRRSLLGSLQHVVLVGERGIGKSFLLETVWQEYKEREWWLVRVSFSQDRQNTPYHGIRQMLYDILQQVYTLPLSEQKMYQEEWKNHVASHGKVITRLLPEIEKIFPPEGEVEELDPEAAQNRFFYVLTKFLQLLVSRKRPIFLVLDHIQWIDSETRRFFSSLLRQNLSYFCVVSVFQGNMNQWETFKRFDEGLLYRLLPVSPWTKDDLKDYLASLLRQKEDGEPLAHTLYEKTEGNPGRFHELLYALVRDELLFLDGYQGWKWKLEEIRNYHFSETISDISELLVSLEEEQRHILRLASCIGNRFLLEMIRDVIGVSEEKILDLFFPLIKKSFFSMKEGMVVWNNPSLREAIYQQLDKEKEHFHYLIGMYFLQQPLESYEEKVYFVLDHILKGLPSLSSCEESVLAIELVMQVAEKNRSSGAFEASYESLRMVIDLVNKCARPDLLKRVYEAYGEAAYYTNHYEELENILQELHQHGYDENACFDLWILFMKALGSQEKYEKATEVFHHLGKCLGLTLPPRVSILHLLPSLIKLKRTVGGISVSSVRTMKQNQQENIEKQGKLLFSFSPLAFFSSPYLNIFINLMGLNLSLKHGILPYTPFWLIAGGIILAGLGDKKKGNHLADIGLYLMEEMGHSTNAPANYVAYYSFLYFWIHPQHEMPEKLLRVYELSRDRGDVEYAAFALMVMSLHQWQVGHSLTLSAEYIKQNVEQIHGLGQFSREIIARLCMQLVDNLTEKKEDPILLEGEWYRESEFYPLHEKEHDVYSLRYLSLYKLILSYLFERYEMAYQVGIKTESYDLAAKCTTAYFLYVLFMGLSAAKLLSSSVRGAKRREFLHHLQQALSHYGQWRKLSEKNFTAGYYLLKGEFARIKKQKWVALHSYRQAIEAAQKNGYRLYEALGFELRGMFWESQGENFLSEQDKASALHLYHQWGAEAKVHELRTKYPFLAKKILDTSGQTKHHTLTATGTQTVDLLTMIKTSEALMNETNVDKLLAHILSMVTENAGAEKGVFLYVMEDQLVVRAVKLSHEDVTVMTINFQEYGDLPHKVIQYSLQTDQEIVVENASEEVLFANDPYVMRNLVRSILVIPVYRVGKRVGLVYLENNMGPGMFTRDRVGTIRVLIAQASIALQNVELLNRVKENTRLETEMNLAKTMQLGLLPKTPSIKGYEIIGFMQTADEVGGDYYDVIGDTNPGWVMIGDVSGHGFSSGQVMSMTQTAIQVLVRAKPSYLPTELLHIANQAITYNIENIFQDDLKYVTITASQVWEDGKIIYAGLHQDIWVFRAATGEVEVFPTDGVWLGVSLVGREVENKELILSSGDIMLLYTDGLTESTHQGEMLEEKGKEVLKIFAPQGIEVVKEKLVDLITASQVRDDVTFVLVKKI